MDISISFVPINTKYGDLRVKKHTVLFDACNILIQFMFRKTCSWLLMFSIQQFKDTNVLADEVIEVNTVNM